MTSPIGPKPCLNPDVFRFEPDRHISCDNINASNPRLAFIFVVVIEDK